MARKDAAKFNNKKWPLLDPFVTRHAKWRTLLWSTRKCHLVTVTTESQLGKIGIFRTRLRRLFRNRKMRSNWFRFNGNNFTFLLFFLHFFSLSLRWKVFKIFFKKNSQSAFQILLERSVGANKLHSLMEFALRKKPTEKGRNMKTRWPKSIPYTNMHQTLKCYYYSTLVRCLHSFCAISLWPCFNYPLLLEFV
jgi:hypothetical protein